MSERSLRDGLQGLLPAEDDEIEDCLIWMAFCELARADTVLAECVADQREEQVALISALTGDRSDKCTVLALLAVIEGLRVALCAPDPLTLATAREVLADELGVRGLGAGAAA